MPDRFSGNDLTCIRGERVVFSRLSFSVHGGQILTLRGPNGSGKSSLLRLMAGLGRPAAGALRWHDGGGDDEEDIADDRAAHRGRLIYIGHQDGLKPALTVRENLSFWASLANAECRVDGALDLFALQPLAAVPARFLSAGERRRLALARLVAIPAPLWLLDEPTVGLDDRALESLLTLLAAHRDAGGMVVLSTHGPLDLGPAETLQMARFAIARGDAEVDEEDDGVRDEAAGAAR